MAISSFGKILTVLDLFSVSRPIINVDIICDELALSKPTAYRYLKELVSTDILKRISGTSGDYTLLSCICSSCLTRCDKATRLATTKDT